MAASRVEPAGRDVEVEQRLDLGEVDGDDIGDGVAHPCFQLCEAGDGIDGVRPPDLAGQRGRELDLLELVGRKYSALAERSNVDPIVALTDWPTTSAIDTTVRPIISAAAVVDVRRGYERRCAGPAGRQRRRPVRIGHPNDAVTAPTASGLSIVTATKIAIAASAKAATVSSVEPTPASPATPRAMLAANNPTAVTSLERGPPSPAAGLAMATTGGTDAARRAGPTAATTVTPIPTTAAATSVRGAMING